MAKGTLGQVIQRAISDAAFRNRLRTDPGGALSGFDLTPAERAALQSGDAAKLASFGVDQRMSKSFAMGEAASGASRLVGTDIGMATTITDGGTPLGTNAILEDAGGSVRNADVDDAGGSVRSAIRDDGGPFDSGSVDDATGTTHNAIRDDGGPFDSGSVDAGSGTTLNAIRDDGGPFDSGSVDGGTAAGREGSAFVTADETGNDAVGGGNVAMSAPLYDSQMEGTASLAASDSNATDAFLTADEMGNNVTASAATAGSDSPAGTAYITSDEAGGDQSAHSDSAMANPEGYQQPDPNAG